MAEGVFVKLGWLFSAILISGCATTPDNRRIWIDDETYKNSIAPYTRTAQAYEGFQNVLDVRMTLMNAKVRNAQTLQKATSFQWSEKEAQADRQYSQDSMLTETRFFLSFFTPESKNDNLAKADTVWRIFLDVDGKRYNGTITRALETPTEILDVYPEHTRWQSAYYVKFMAPTRLVEEGPSKITITGPVGSAELQFQP